MRGRLAATLAVAAVAAVPAVARADYGDTLPWSDILPPAPTTSNPQPHSTPGCVTPSIDCVRGVVAEMNRRWVPLDRSCDHRAVFALTYLRTTEGVRDTLLREPNFFDDRGYLLWEDALFADYYFRAYDNYVSGKGFVPGAWRIAFEAAAHGDANGGQDVLLGMNAHIRRDLPYVLAEDGLHKPNGDSRKPDHDKVNRILGRVLDGIQAEVGYRYDPYFDWTDLPGVPADEQGLLETIKSWREEAWRNAERLLNATSEVERQAVAASIESTSEAGANSIASPQQPGWRAQRDAYCHSRLAPERELRARARACGRTRHRKHARRRKHAHRRRHGARHAKAHRRRHRAHRRHKARRCRRAKKRHHRKHRRHRARRHR